MDFLRRNPIGHITGADGEYDVPDGNTLIPDVGYISKERQAKLDTDAIPFSPDLAIEIQSKTDRKRTMRLKAERYLQNGSKMVWLVFLDKTAEVYTPDDDVVTLSIDDVLSGGDVLPDLTIPLKEIFPA